VATINEVRSERGLVLTPDERLTREQAVRLYTINNAYLNSEEKTQGSLEVGKAGDLISVRGIWFDWSALRPRQAARLPKQPWRIATTPQAG
jgi:predicted amidohydrolase YtcJ